MKYLTLVLYLFSLSSCNVLTMLTQDKSSVDSSFFGENLKALEVYEFGTQNQEKIITLGYTGNTPPTSCSVANLENAQEITPCACNQGVCTVGLMGITDFYGFAYADFLLFDDSSTSTSSKITLEIDFTCQQHWTRVPANPDFGIHDDFCVMTYEASSNGSDPSIQPELNVSANEAKPYCTALGTGYDLISNPEWMTIAHNVEEVAANWSGGAVGSGCLKQGNIGTAITGCSYNNSNSVAYAGSRDPVSKLMLSNGQEIWDFSGNLSEWVDWIPGGGFDLAPTSCQQTNIELYNVNCTGLTVGDYLPSNPMGIAEADYNSSLGLGQVYIITTGGDAALRGGEYTSGQAQSGIYNLYTALNPGNSFQYTGFRCVWRPTF